MSVEIQCRNLVKRYGSNTVIPKLDLQIRQGEFFTLLGPSGCGKTTLLRMIAGFNTIEEGEICFDGNIINCFPPNKRNIGMVFQNYAIFPHMSVKKNVAFGLTNRKVQKDEIENRVDQVLKAVKIDNLKDRMPENMSGGQQQRIALARAIVIRPDVLLMDEPLSNLDAKLRIEMREVIHDIQREVGITTVYVTHDQEEAMAVSDRIAVMKDGIVQQVGTPRSIYHRPANIFVATFIGNSNILDGNLVKKDGKYVLMIGSCEITAANLDASLCREGTVKLSVRPEEFLVKKTKEHNCLNGTVAASTFLGTNTHYNIKLETGDTIKIVQESQEIDFLEQGDSVSLGLNMEKINIYSADGSQNYSKGTGDN